MPHTSHTIARAAALGLALATAASHAQEAPMELTSTAFVHQQEIPARHTCDGPDVSPPLAWKDVPAGTRSLATARMFLFDLSERLFAPRDKALASRYREALREARDPQAMLAVGRALIADVQALAGSERADGIRARLAKLLPAHLLESAA